MPIDVRIRDYVSALDDLLYPCEAIDFHLIESRITIVAKKKQDAELFCPRCGHPCTQRGTANSRLVRHLDFDGIPVWIDIAFPRVFCIDHGHLVARQRFCNSRCRTSHALEDHLLKMICDSDTSESELTRKFGLCRSTLSRVIDRSRLSSLHSPVVATSTPSTKVT